MAEIVFRAFAELRRKALPAGFLKRCDARTGGAEADKALPAKALRKHLAADVSTFEAQVPQMAAEVARE
jgi:hypothetical protein